MLATTTHRETLQLVFCKAGLQTYAIPMNQIVGVERSDKLDESKSIQGSVGTYTTRGQEWPVYPLTWWLGEDSTSVANKGQILFIEHRQGVTSDRPHRFGILIDRVTQSVKINSEKFFPANDTMNQSRAFVSSIVMTDSGPTLVIDPSLLDPAYFLSFNESHEEASPIPPKRVSSASQLNSDRFLTLARQELPGRSDRMLALALPASNIREMISWIQPAVMPGNNSAILGVIRWRERPISVFDPLAWLGLPKIIKPARIVIATLNGVTVGLASGIDVKMMNANSPMIPTRYRVNGHSQLFDSVVDTTDLTILVPRWDLLDHRPVGYS